MSYVPLNLAAFSAAFAGAAAGMGVSERIIKSTAPATYASTGVTAGAFAQSFDTQWAVAGGYNDATTNALIQSACEAVWSGRTPTLTSPTNYTSIVGAIIAVVLAAQSYLAGQGVPPQPASDAVIFDGGTPENVRSDRGFGQSPIDASRNGIVNFGSQTTPFFPPKGATNHYSTICGGLDNNAFGIYSCIGGGLENVASGTGAFATGQFSNAFADQTLCFGFGGTAGGSLSLCGGFTSTSAGVASVAVGNVCSSAGNYSASLGTNTAANGVGSVAVGELTAANGNHAFCSGMQNTANGIYSSGAGRGSVTRMAGQHAIAAGFFLDFADAQSTVCVQRGETPGVGAGETASLGGGDVATQRFLTEDTILGNGYTLRVFVTAAGYIAGVPVSRTLIRTFLLRTIAPGVNTLVDSSALESYGDVAAASWALTGSFTALNEFTLVFDTGITTANCRVCARIESVEVAYP